jgi:hypothetical protein
VHQRRLTRLLRRVINRPITSAKIDFQNAGAPSRGGTCRGPGANQEFPSTRGPERAREPCGELGDRETGHQRPGPVRRDKCFSQSKVRPNIICAFRSFLDRGSAPSEPAGVSLRAWGSCRGIRVRRSGGFAMGYVVPPRVRENVRQTSRCLMIMEDSVCVPGSRRAFLSSKVLCHGW